MKAEFCRFCGTKLRMRYPGGDPENGPARPSCPNNEHPCPEDERYELATRVAEAILTEFGGEWYGLGTNGDEPQVYDTIVNLVLDIK